MERRSPTDAQNMSADVYRVLSISKPTLQFFFCLILLDLSNGVLKPTFHNLLFYNELKTF